MDSVLALAELEELVQKLGIEIRRESLPGPGGLCEIRGKGVLFLNRELPASDQVQTIAEALGGRDLSHVYVRPALRRLLGEVGGADP